MKADVNLSRKLIAGLVVAAASIATTPAMADVYVKELGTAAGINSGGLILPVGTDNYFSGQQNISVALDVAATSATSFIAYCVDPANFSSTSYQDYYSPSVASSVSSKFGARATTIQNFYDKYYAGTAGDSAKAAAFQLALWEIANDDRNLATGVVRKIASPPLVTNSTLVSDVDTLLGDLSYAGPQNYSLTLYAVNRELGVGQDYIVASPVLVASSVPEPESYGLLVAGLGLLGAMIRRGARQAA